MSKKQALFFLILILLLTASLAGLTYFLAKKRVQPQPEKISPANTNAQVQDLEPPAIDTSNWLTYRNEEYGFEVQYPEGWCVDIYDCGESRDKESIYIKLIDYDSLPKVSEYQGPGINNKDDFEKSYENFKQSKELIQINDFEVSIGYKYDVPSASSLRAISFFASKNKHVDIYIIFPDIYWNDNFKELNELEIKKIHPKEVQTFDQIISTLKKIE